MVNTDVACAPPPNISVLVVTPSVLFILRYLSTPAASTKVYQDPAALIFFVIITVGLTPKP
jgi:hypothetical protein